MEGIIAKNGDSPYVSDRSREWLKFKCINQQEFVITGYTDPLLAGYYERGRLRYAGKVGTGYSTDTLRRLGKQLAGLETATKAFDEPDLPHSGSTG